MRTLWTLVAFGIVTIILGASLALTAAAPVSRRPAFCLDGPVSEDLETSRHFGPPSCGQVEIDVP